MSRNGSGIYNLPTGNPVVTGTTITSNWANTTLSDISTALTGSLASDGQTPVTGDIQMGGNKVTGMGTPTSAQDATTKAYVDAGVAALGTMATQNSNNVAITGGSITGAPKLRSMEIIEELEPHRRGLYCGAVGYIGFDGNMDTNIAIRTAIYSRGEIRFYAGGGIVADSELSKEHSETLDKASSMLALIQRFGGDVALKESKP